MWLIFAKWATRNFAKINKSNGLALEEEQGFAILIFGQLLYILHIICLCKWIHPCYGQQEYWGHQDQNLAGVLIWLIISNVGNVGHKQKSRFERVGIFLFIILNKFGGFCSVYWTKFSSTQNNRDRFQTCPYCFNLPIF